MKKGLIITLAIVGVIVLWAISTQRGLVGYDETINNKWGDVQSAYQRRGDLIDNLVQTVKGEANFEKSTLEGVIQARASATQMKIDPTNLTPEKLQEFQANQGQLSQALGRLMVVTENYPQLRANESFKKLMDEISGTENRINRSRDVYNETVRPYNVKVRAFPNSIMAGIMGFKSRGYFEADAASQKAPKVNFDGVGGSSNTTPAGSTTPSTTPSTSTPKAK